MLGFKFKEGKLLTHFVAWAMLPLTNTTVPSRISWGQNLFPLRPWVHLTFGLSDDVADSKSLTDVMEGLVPWITPLINIIIRTCPQHVVHCIITGTCEKNTLYSTAVSSSACMHNPPKHCWRTEGPLSPLLTTHIPSPIYLSGKALHWGSARRQDSNSTLLNSCVRME